MNAVQGFCFYNYNKVAGASQTHKHLQVVPFEHFKTPLLDHILKIVENEDLNGEDFIKINLSMFLEYKYAAYKFKEFNHNDTQEQYEQFLQRVY